MITLDVESDRLPELMGLFSQLVETGVRKQTFVTEGDAKTNIQKYQYIDTGAALNSTRGEMLGPRDGQVSVNAESPDGFPYPVVGNFGSVHQAPRPFFSEAEAKARLEFGERMAAELRAALG